MATGLLQDFQSEKNIFYCEYAQTKKIKPRQTVWSKLTHQITKVLLYLDWITDTEQNDSNIVILKIKSADNA